MHSGTATQVVVGDLHGNHWALRLLLQTVGVIDGSGVRQPGYFVLHIGDIINGVLDSRAEDAAILELTDWFDVMIPGNHDLWWLRQHPAGRFGGMDEYLQLRHPEARAKVQEKSAAAFALGGYLITHAGLHAFYENVIATHSADLAASAINFLWERSPLAPVFTDVGRRRGGAAMQGGIFWCDWNELIAMPAPVPQIVGHTPQPQGPVYDALHDIWSVDVGAKIGHLAAALVREPGATKWTPVTTSAAVPDPF